MEAVAVGALPEENISTASPIRAAEAAGAEPEEKRPVTSPVSSSPDATGAEPEENISTASPSSRLASALARFSGVKRALRRAVISVSFQVALMPKRWHGARGPQTGITGRPSG